MKVSKTFASAFVALAAVILAPVTSVDRHKFKTCHQASFCRRARAVEPGNSPYYVDLSTLTESTTMVETVLVNEKNGVQFRLEIFGLKGETIRFRLREAFPLAPRFEVPEVLVGDPEQVQTSPRSFDAYKLGAKLYRISLVVRFTGLRIYHYIQLNSSINAWAVLVKMLQLEKRSQTRFPALRRWQ